MADYRNALAQHQKFYHDIWSGMKAEVASLLEENGFTLKDSDIGNVHGEVYANADVPLAESTGLYQILFAPTQEGKLAMKLTFDAIRRAREVRGQLKSAKLFVSLSELKAKENGRYEMMCYYVLKEKPTIAPEALRSSLLERIEVLLCEISRVGQICVK
ncbi:MAG: hypothetical protein C0618_04345 [Desulfuromonas sp.]|nr:MAG: hypothetical protein C0618_04345 [Desulfuromonas sp.]